MKRADALRAITAAGYHRDSRTMLRLYTENRISYERALEAWRKGHDARERGVRCGCRECSESIPRDSESAPALTRSSAGSTPAAGSAAR